MDISLFLFAGLYNVVRPCPFWVFPEDVPGGDCCAQKKFGEELFNFIGFDNTAVVEYQCQSNCTYAKDSEEDSLYCFKDGYTEVKTECLTSFNCTINSVKELQSSWNTSIALINKDLVKLMDYGSGHSSHPYTFDAFLKEAMRLILRIISPAQQLIFRDSSPCTPVRHECDQCYASLLDTLLNCFKYNEVTLCNNTATAATVTCKSCLCEISRKCNQNITCPEETKNHTESPEAHHPCDRDCSQEFTKPLKCVYNLTLDRSYSNEDGRRADGRNRSVMAYNGQIPGPPIFICEGDDLVVNVVNNIDENSSNLNDTTTLHFHGFRENLRPYDDGVPFVTQCPIIPKGNFTYGFKATKKVSSSPGRFTQAGTYWYHSHVGDQRTNGAYGALVIRPKKTWIAELIDHSNKTIILQEWYESPANQTVKSLLINGNGRVSTWTGNFTTNYTEIGIDNPGDSYLFRIIGAISQNFPLRLSIDDHTFTAIAADSQDIEPVYDLTDLWVAAGERFHIVVNTKQEYRSGKAYKIRVMGYSNIRFKTDPFCTIAWLKYPNQTIDYDYTTKADCSDFLDLPSKQRTLNPVPNSFTEWNKRLTFGQWNKTNETGNIYIKDLRALKPKRVLQIFSHKDTVQGAGLNNTQYLELDGLTFNNISMNYSNVPFLLQDDDSYENDQCGTVCKAKVIPPTSFEQAETNRYLNVHCLDKNPDKCTGKANCLCPHVLQQPFAPGYWVDVVLINKDKDATAHPIHVHGGWFWVMGMDQFNHSINSTHIKNLNQACEDKDHCLWKDAPELPVAKDTIQVPPGGYVILRIPLDNKGTWFMHCHVNNHLRAGMALVLQVGGFGKLRHLGQDWCTGHLKRNEACPTPPPIPIDFVWSLPMEPTKKCVAPGTKVTFLVDGHHNVQEISKENYNICNVSSNANMAGEYVWTAPSDPAEEFYYFACGMGDGWHCNHGMKAIVQVKKNCT